MSTERSPTFSKQMHFLHMYHTTRSCSCQRNSHMKMNQEEGMIYFVHFSTNASVLMTASALISVLHVLRGICIINDDEEEIYKRAEKSMKQLHYVHQGPTKERKLPCFVFMPNSSMRTSTHPLTRYDSLRQ